QGDALGRERRDRVAGVHAKAQADAGCDGPPAEMVHMDPTGTRHEFLEPAAWREANRRYRPGDYGPAVAFPGDHDEAGPGPGGWVADHGRGIHTFSVEAGDYPLAFLVVSNDASEGRLGAEAGGRNGCSGCGAAASGHEF